MVIKKRVVIKKEPTIKIPTGWRERKSSYHENAYCELPPPKNQKMIFRKWLPKS